MDIGPGYLIVALAALRIGARMGGWFALGHIVVMAAGAAGGHAFKYAANMADFARHVLMCAFQRKTCSAVIEVLVDFCEAVCGLRKCWRYGKRKYDREQSE
jgi:hypothetical protein